MSISEWRDYACNHCHQSTSAADMHQLRLQHTMLYFTVITFLTVRWRENDE